MVRKVFEQLKFYCTVASELLLPFFFTVVPERERERVRERDLKSDRDRQTHREVYHSINLLRDLSFNQTTKSRLPEKQRETKRERV